MKKAAQQGECAQRRAALTLSLYIIAFSASKGGAKETVRAAAQQLGAPQKIQHLTALEFSISSTGLWGSILYTPALLHTEMQAHSNSTSGAA